MTPAALLFGAVSLLVGASGSRSPHVLLYERPKHVSYIAMTSSRMEFGHSDYDWEGHRPHGLALLSVDPEGNGFLTRDPVCLFDSGSKLTGFGGDHIVLPPLNVVHYVAFDYSAICLICNSW